MLKCLPNIALFCYCVGIQPSGILIRCPNHLFWLLSIWSSSDYSELPPDGRVPHPVSMAPSKGNLFQLLVTATSFFQSLLRSRDHRWGWEWRWTSKSEVLPSGSAVADEAPFCQIWRAEFCADCFTLSCFTLSTSPVWAAGHGWRSQENDIICKKHTCWSSKTKHLQLPDYTLGSYPWKSQTE